MDKKFEIELPKVVQTPESKRSIIRGAINEDNAREGLLAKTLIFTYLHQPVTVTEITNHLNAHYGLDIDRTKIYRALMWFVQKNIMVMESTNVIFSLEPTELTEIQLEVERKHRKFLSPIPKQFASRFEKVNYYWISNGEGLNYIEWCCKILGYKITEIK
jgi:hypothetical protein